MKFHPSLEKCGLLKIICARNLLMCPPSRFHFFSGFLAALAWCGGAHAGELTLKGDQTMVMTLTEKPGTIIVSNPDIADVTLKSNTLLLLGKSFGNTNLIVLDADGRQTQSWQVHVVRDDPFGVAVFKAGKQETFTCRTDCEIAGGTSQAGK